MVGELMRPRIGQGGDTNEPSFVGILMMRLGSPSHGADDDGHPHTENLEQFSSK